MIRLDNILYTIYPLSKHFCLQRGNSNECSFGGGFPDNISLVRNDPESSGDPLESVWDLNSFASSDSESENEIPGNIVYLISEMKK